MSWKVHKTDDVFEALRGLCSNSYRMYDPSEHRSYYDHDCDVYECAVEDAVREYERLLRHCDHQRQELAKLTRYMQGETPTETIDLLMGLLNEYRESGCAIDEDRVSWYARRLDGRAMNERTETEQGSSITDELRRYASAVWTEEDYGKVVHIPNGKLLAIADRIDEQHAKECDKAYCKGVCDGIDADKNAMGYINPPVGADGVPIHIRDKVTRFDFKTVETVERIELDKDGWWIITDMNFGTPDCMHHVQPDSWERIIADARESSGFRTIGGELPKHTDAELVERCKKLAGEAE